MLNATEFHICSTDEDTYEDLLCHTNALGTPDRFVMTSEDYQDLDEQLKSVIEVENDYV